MHSYEYLFTAIIIFAILIASTTIVSIMPQPSINVSEKEQLKTVAQKIMTQLTLNPGNPPDWGSNLTVGSSTLTAFGLAKYGEIARGAYVLDLDKVQRLNENLPQNLYVPPSRVIDLLNLGNDYGIKIEFVPALNATVATEINSNSATIYVNVTGQNMLPIANVNVTARIFYLYDGQIQKTPIFTNFTGIDGQCMIKFDGFSSEDALLVLVIDYYGIRIIKTCILNAALTQAFFLGDHLILNSSLSIISDTAYQIIVAESDGTYMIDYALCGLNLTNEFSVPSYSLYEINYTEPSAIALLAVANGGSDLMVACKSVPSCYSSIPGDASSPLIYMLERSVKIGESLYTMRLEIWRMSW